jgi:ATP-dependent DNA helicase RecQ
MDAEPATEPARPRGVDARLRAAARDRFGWADLSAEQLAAMRALMAGRDVLVVLPTGAGKSGIYQVPATLLDGPTLVVSPLLALQHDQITGLRDRGDGALAAVRLSSADRAGERAAALRALHGGHVEYVFVTPEQLADPARLDAIRAARPSLVAIDEAHCVSAWGHDFRPDYLQLGHAIRALGQPPVAALTATASPPVREDVVGYLGLRDPLVVVAGLDRPNVFLEAVACVDDEQRWRRLRERVAAAPGPGIVYAPTRRATEELAARLVESGVTAAAYHGGMPAGRRRDCHEAFLSGRLPVVVATSAFGMGIDKPDIRWVNHVALPDSPDSYLQEVGRAGRDGEPAQALLLWRAADTALQRYFTAAVPGEDELTRLAGALATADGPLGRAQLRERTGLGPRKLGVLLGLLEQVGAAVGVRGGRWRVPGYAPQPAQAARLAVEQARRRRVVQRSRLDMMRHYAETTGCRTQALLAYFGEHLAERCGHCDSCLSGSAEEVDDGGDVPFGVHTRVRHGEWGEGVVLRYEDDRMTVLFDDVGYKTLAVPVVVDQGLLAPAG